MPAPTGSSIPDYDVFVCDLLLVMSSLPGADTPPQLLPDMSSLPPPISPAVSPAVRHLRVTVVLLPLGTSRIFYIVCSLLMTPLLVLLWK